jgi:hypothetical protein
MTDRYKGKTVALLTQHGKEALLSPLLEPALGCTIVRAEGYDTDQLGSFSGEIQRPDGQLQTARRKARIGMSLTGATVGLASEGAFVPDPLGGLMPWNIEVLVWLDDDSQIEIVGVAQGPARSLHRALRWLPELEKFALEAGFPEHHLSLRPQHETDPRVRKGLSDWHALRQAFAACQQEADNQMVHAENDHRAFCDPTRQSMIRQAAQDLLKKIQSSCPACSLPGFAITGHSPGLPCKLCGQATRLAKSYIWSCRACGHRLEQATPHAHAEPGRCDVCNP